MSAGRGADFLSRWSRLKQEAREQQTAAPDPAAATPPATTSASANEAPPELPPVESLTFDSDYRAFLHPKVADGVRRLALKKLFSDPHFNVMDGLDIYIDDYSVSEPLPPAMLEQLEQARKILAWSREDAERRAAEEAARSVTATDASELPGEADEPPKGTA